VRKSVTYYKDNEKTIETIFSYNKNGLISKTIRKDPEGNLFKRKYEYNNDGQLVFRRNKKGNGIKLYYDKFHRHISTYLINKKGREWKTYTIKYNGDSDQKTSTISTYYTTRSILGEDGYMEVEKGDVLKKEYYYHETGLINYTKQYLNGELNAVKKYKYLR